MDFYWVLVDCYWATIESYGLILGLGEYLWFLLDAMEVLLVSKVTIASSVTVVTDVTVVSTITFLLSP